MKNHETLRHKIIIFLHAITEFCSLKGYIDKKRIIN